MWQYMRCNGNCRPHVWPRQILLSSISPRRSVVRPRNVQSMHHAENPFIFGIGNDQLTPNKLHAILPPCSQYCQCRPQASSPMPKLSSYLSQSGLVPGPAQQQPGGSSSTQAAVSRELQLLQDRHAKRVRDHGPRKYRHPDGSLRDTPPPASPYTAANRRRWAPLVTHIRQLPGAVQGYDRTGVSARYGLGVDEEAHAAALAALGITSEQDAAGHWSNFDPHRVDPLQDPQHVLCHKEWRAVTAAMLQRAEGVHGRQLLEDAEYLVLQERCRQGE